MGPKKEKKDGKPFDFLTANLDELESEEDDDYVPDAKAIKESEKELEKQNGTKSKLEDDKELTGIQLLKEQKRQKETDDLFDLMNEEDDFYQKRKL